MYWLSILVFVLLSSGLLALFGVKLNDMFSILYREKAVTLSDDGFIDLQKTRKPLRFDFSHINADKTFEETIDGNDTQQYKVTFDSAGRIASIQDENGHITEVVWE